MKHTRAYATSTERILQRWRIEKNVVTRSVLATIIGDRIDRHELARMKK